MSAGSSRWLARRCVLVTATPLAIASLVACGRVPSNAPEVVVVIGSATANEPAPVLTATDRGLLRTAGANSARAWTYVVNPNTGQAIRLPLTPRRADGQVEYTQPQRGDLLAGHLDAVQRALDREAADRPFDLLADMAAAVRVTADRGTLLVISSGLSTAGGFNLRLVGWDASPGGVAAELARRGLLPDLSGWQVAFSGLADTTSPQPTLPQPQRTTLIAYWIAICRAAGALTCTADETTRPDPPSRSTTPVPVVTVPRVRSVRGPGVRSGTSVPDDQFFAFGSSRLLPGADRILGPVAARARRYGLFVSITGFASPDGGASAYNLALSKRRALAVQARLIALGVAASRIAAEWRGVAGRSARACYRAGQLDEAVCARLRRVVILTSQRP